MSLYNKLLLFGEKRRNRKRSMRVEIKLRRVCLGREEENGGRALFRRAAVRVFWCPPRPPSFVYEVKVKMCLEIYCGLELYHHGSFFVPACLFSPAGLWLGSAIDVLGFPHLCGQTDRLCRPSMRVRVSTCTDLRAFADRRARGAALYAAPFPQWSVN